MRQGPRWKSPSLAQWLLTGLLLDGLWLALSAAGIFALYNTGDFVEDNLIVIFYLWALSAALPPWFIHGLALPKLFGGRLSWNAAVGSLLYIAASALVVPIVSVIAYFPCMLLSGALDALAAKIFPSPNHVLNWFVLMLIPVPAGAVLGRLIAGLRERTLEEPSQIGRWAEVLGGALGAYINAGVYLFVTVAIADIAPPWMRTNAAFLPILTFSSLLGCLPHLILTGRDVRRINPPRATSASGAAPSAPSR